MSGGSLIFQFSGTIVESSGRSIPPLELRSPNQQSLKFLGQEAKILQGYEV